MLPTRVHAIVLVSKVHKPTMRALAYAKATRPNVLEAVLVDADAASTARMLEEWDERRIDVPLKVLYSPYREIIRPVVEYVRSIRDANPRGVVAVYIPEYVVGPLVGAGAAQPDRAAAQGPAAVHAGRDGDVGALPAALLGAGQAARRAGGSTRSAPVTSAAARRCASPDQGPQRGRALSPVAAPPAPEEGPRPVPGR